MKLCTYAVMGSRLGEAMDSFQESSRPSAFLTSGKSSTAMWCFLHNNGMEYNTTNMWHLNPFVQAAKKMHAFGVSMSNAFSLQELRETPYSPTAPPHHKAIMNRLWDAEYQEYYTEFGFYTPA